MLTRLVLLDPECISARLALAEREGLIDRAPNTWQLTLGILRMWHRVLFRSETIGLSTTQPIRPTWRARLFAYRPLRFPFLLAERAVAPWDFSGLLSDTDRIVSHLLGAHHDGVQFVYDLELLRCHPGALERVRDEARAVVHGTTPRAAYLRDLVVYERYHECLLEAVERALAGDLPGTPDELANPDISLSAHLAWCARQPATPTESIQSWLS